MAILWCGSEDIDFPVGAGTMAVSTSARRAAYARTGVQNTHATRANFLQSRPFSGGAVTSAWFTAQIAQTIAGTSKVALGVSLSTTSKGLYIGTDTASTTKLALYKFDGTTLTSLATESSTSVAGNTNTTTRVDVQIVNYGASATVNVYYNSVLLITYSGDVTVSGMTNFDSVAMLGNAAANWAASEIVVADEDTRPLLGLLTMAPTATGTTNNWTNNTVTNVNPTTITDANAASVNTDAQDQQYNVTDEPAGTFVVKAVRVAARAWSTAGAVTPKIKLGFNSGGSVAVGTTQTTTTTATTFEQLWDTTNPVTGAPWGSVTEINALQVNLRSST